MPRDKRKVHKHPVPPEIKYQNFMVAKLINKVMLDGKKSIASRIVYQALEIVADKTKKEPIQVYEEALKNITPAVEVKARRIGGAAYQVPIEVKGDRKIHLTLKWLVDAARARRGIPMSERLAAEIMDAASGQGAAFKKKEDAHRMAEANKAMAHLARF